MKKDIISVLDDLQDLMMMKEDLDTEIKRIQMQVKDYMSQAKLDTLYGHNSQRVLYKDVTVQKFNSSLFRKKYAELYSAFQKPVIMKRFQFTY